MDHLCRFENRAQTVKRRKTGHYYSPQQISAYVCYRYDYILLFAVCRINTRIFCLKKLYSLKVIFTGSPQYNIIRREVMTLNETSKQNRFRSWVMWSGIAGALWLIASALGLPQKIGLTDGTYITIVNAIGAILTLLGVVNNPTDRGGI